MKIEFWMDYLCPLSFQTHKNIENIIKHNQFPDLEILYRSYEMIPNLKDNQDFPTLYDVFIKHHLLTEDETQGILNHFEDLVRNLRPVPVMDAHRLSHLAKKSGLAFEFNQAIFKAFFVDKFDISDHQVLMDVAKEAGLHTFDVRNVLGSDQFLEAVHLNRENALVKGIHQIPHMRVDGRI
ncbi:MAG: DsbA family protein, partial [Acholeplasmataceae bacterium]|nr:DsbA family protein [Acholeplasmataceae bacterium]